MINVVSLSIGLDFVKNIDKNWKKRLQSIDRMEEDYKFEESLIKNAYNDDNTEIIGENPERDIWKYWKNKYQIIR